MGDGVVVDLFGDPVPLHRGRKGRPAHVPSTQNRAFVVMLLAAGHDPKDIAQAIVPGGLSMPTFRKYYFSELDQRRFQRLRVKGHLLVTAMEQANKGNVGAIKLVAGEMARAEMGPPMAAQGERAKAEPKIMALGKKEQERVDAMRAGVGTSWEDLTTAH